jgi:predicted site-specific integrase-resolvase
MELMTIKQAAKAIYVTPGVIQNWASKSRIQKYPFPNQPHRYLVSLDEVKRALKSTRLTDKTTETLITLTQAAQLLGVSPRAVSYYVKMGYVKAHYVFENNNKHYLVDKSEVLAQPSLSQERSRHTHRLDELKERERGQYRAANGHWAKRPTVA